MANQKNRAVIYARFSCHQQTEQSIEGQIDVCTKFANDNGIKIVDKYIDRAMTGTNDKRPAFQKMLKDSAKHSFDFVLVYKLDRFARNRYDSAVNKAMLKRNGVCLISATENISDKPEGIILEGMLESFAEYYSAELSQKVKRGQAESLKKKQFMGGLVPYGYKIVNKKYAIINPEAVIVKNIFNQYNAGVGIKSIASDLNKKGIKTHLNKIFTISSIVNILKNIIYTGTFVYNGIEYEDYLPAIIDKTTFQTAQTVLNANKHKTLKGDSDVHYYLSGKLYCGDCGKLLLGESGTGHMGKTYYYYKCNGKKKGHACKNSAYQKDLLEQKVMEIIAKEVYGSDMLQKLIDGIVKISEEFYAGNSNLEYYKTQMENLEKQKTSILNAIKSGIFDLSMNNEFARINSEMAELQTKIENENLSKQFVLNKETVTAWFEQFRPDVEAKKISATLIDALIKRIDILNEHITITFNNSELSCQKSLDFPMGSNEMSLVVRSNEHSNLYINRLFFVIKTNLNCYLPIKK